MALRSPTLHSLIERALTIRMPNMMAWYCKIIEAASVDANRPNYTNTVCERPFKTCGGVPTWQQGKDTQKQYLLEPLQVRSFQQAKDFCEGQDNGASLAIIKSEQENTAVFSLANEQGVPEEGKGTTSWIWIWLGVTNQRRTGDFCRFLWLDGIEITNSSFTK